MLQRSRWSFVLAFLVAGATACQSDDTTEAPAPAVETPTFAAAGEAPAAEAAAEAAPEAEAEEEAEAATHSVSTRVVTNDDGSTQLIADISPGPAYKINVADGFPWRMAVAADAPVAAGASCGREGATRFEEAGVTFELNAGETGAADSISGQVVLGVCDDAGCIRVQEDVTWTLASR